MSPAIREFLKRPCFQEVKSTGGAVIITGIRPPGPQLPPAPQSAEPTNPPTEFRHEKQ